jgi:hypothetical protein
MSTAAPANTSIQKIAATMAPTGADGLSETGLGGEGAGLKSVAASAGAEVSVTGAG